MFNQMQQGFGYGQQPAMPYMPDFRDIIAGEINAYKNSAEYKEHPEYADGMMDVWTDKHGELMAHNARVKAMVDTFK